MADNEPARGLDKYWGMPDHEYKILVSVVRRARKLLGGLNDMRTSEDIERVRKGAEHELEYALRLLRAPWDWASQVSPGARPVVDVELPLNPEEEVKIEVVDPPLFDT